MFPAPRGSFPTGDCDRRERRERASGTCRNKRAIRATRVMRTSLGGWGGGGAKGLEQAWPSRGQVAKGLGNQAANRCFSGDETVQV